MNLMSLVCFQFSLAFIYKEISAAVTPPVESNPRGFIFPPKTQALSIKEGFGSAGVLHINTKIRNVEKLPTNNMILSINLTIN